MALLANPSQVDELALDRIPSLLGDLECLRARLWARMMIPRSSQTATTGDLKMTVLLDVPTAAARLHVPRSYVYELGRRGELPIVKVGAKYVRIRADDLEAWIVRHKNGISERMQRTSTKQGAR